jgi:uncharacterized protein with FMN-binding domain
MPILKQISTVHRTTGMHTPKKKTDASTRNKILVSAGLVIATAVFAFSQKQGTVTAATTSPSAPIAQTQVAATATAVPVQPTGSTLGASSGQYTDGSYTGTAVDAYYGALQVLAVIQGGKLTDVQFLQYPSSRSTSQQINNNAMAALKKEAISAQNANVNTVSGATDTSASFRQSLGSALAQAKA